MILGAGVNVLLDNVFMYPLDMGIGRAALATALEPLLSVLILLPHFLWKQGELYFEKCRLTHRDMEKILFFGFPSFIMEFSIGIVTFVYNIATTYYGYGETGLAAASSSNFSIPSPYWQEMGISQQHYSKYETGEYELPLRHFITLAEYYGVSADYLIGRCSYGEKKPLELVYVTRDCTYEKLVQDTLSLSDHGMKSVVEYVELQRLKEKQKK